MARRTAPWGLIGVSLVLSACSGGSRGGGPDSGFAQDHAADIPYIKETAPPPADEGRVNHAPVLARIGDRVVAVGETLTIQVEASDPDGDPLTYSLYGDIPQGARFDKEAHVFTWVPLQAGKAVYLTFAVSDGTDMDRETVQVKVVAEKTGHPPVFEKVSDQKVQVGVPVALALRANDPDGDPLEYAIKGQPPAQSHLDSKTGQFDWVPPKEADHTVVTVAFVVSDGTYQDQMEVRFLVGDVGDSPPVFQPIPEQEAVVGQELRFTVRATDPDGAPVTLEWIEGKMEAAFFDDATGEFRWTPGSSDAGRTVVLKFQASDGQYTAYLTVKVTVVSATPPPACSDDSFEPNNEPSQAKALAVGIYDLSICDTARSPMDSDWFLISLKAQEAASVRLDFEHDLGDIDMDLSEDGSADTIVAFSAGTSDVEEFEFVAPKDSTYILAIYGVANTTYANPYRLTFSVKTEAQCEDDAFEPNDTPAEATVVEGTYQNFPSLIACANDQDWFAVPLHPADGLMAAVTPSQGSVALAILDANQKVQDQAGPASAPSTVAVDNVPAEGTYFVKVSSAAGAKYGLEVLVVPAASGGCTSKSCEKGKVCDPAKGTCVSDFCEGSGDCPAGMPCIETYCVEPCKGASDCRTGYACKAFPQGTYCAEVGSGKSGAPCWAFAECAGDRICLFQEQGGYCATYGCGKDSDCYFDAWCVQGSGMKFCAAECATDADCNASAGFRCRPATSLDAVSVSVCLP